MSRRLMEIQNQINRDIPELMATGFPTTFGGMPAGSTRGEGPKNTPRPGRILKIFRRKDLVNKGAKARPLFEHDSSDPRHTNDAVELWLGRYLTSCQPKGGTHYPSAKRRNRCEVCGKTLRLVPKSQLVRKPAPAGKADA